MRIIASILTLCLFALSCSTLRPDGSGSTASTHRSFAAGYPNDLASKVNSTDRFGDINSIDPQSFANSPAIIRGNRTSRGEIEGYSLWQFKYAIMLDVPVEKLGNQKLFSFVDEWYGTKYHFGGNSKDGIDCSAFVSLLMSSVYGITNLPRMSKDQFVATVRIARKNLCTGDLVFFHTYGKHKRSVTHVGVFLYNNKFVHASVSGVMVSDLNTGYYATHYIGAGRMNGLMALNTKR